MRSAKAGTQTGGWRAVSLHPPGTFHAMHEHTRSYTLPLNTAAGFLFPVFRHVILMDGLFD